MYEVLFDQWLYASESDSLDFKRDQYKFIKASDEEKSELLKDILAMANSWRRVDGYIVVGIEDKPEKPNLIYGITEHIDDADIQQFVNGKVYGTCLFEYSTFTKEGKTVGIIRVPIQERPVYLTKSYVSLKAEAVYVRRGSSTDIAKPDEVSKMGLANQEIKIPKLEVGFYNVSNNKMIGDVLEKETIYLKILDEIPEYTKGPHIMMPTMGKNSAYYKEYFEFINFEHSYIPLQFAVKNIGDIEAANLKFELEITSNDIDIILDGDEVEEPQTTSSFIVNSALLIPSSSYRLDKHEGLHKINNTLDRLHAKRTLTFKGTVYLQAKKSEILNVKATMFFDGQSNPYERNLQIKIHCKKIELPWKDFYKTCFQNNT